MDSLARPALLVVLLSACGGDGGGGSRGRLVVVGDNVASSPSTAESFPALLATNDDALFPEFAGHDLARAMPGTTLVRLDRGGDSYHGLATDPSFLCACGADGCPAEACLAAADGLQTAVLVELGANDLVSMVLRLLARPALRDDPTPAIDDFRADVQAVLARASDPEVVGPAPRVYVTNVADPTDGTGTIDVDAALLPIPDLADVPPELALDVLARFNEAIEAETAAIGGTVIDVHGHALGHGLAHADEDAPYYDAEDPSLWLQGIVDPNLRGAHEVRRLVWAAIGGEPVDALPSTDLPGSDLEPLPDVPDDGWAVAVAGAQIPTSYATDDHGSTSDNLAADPSAVIGPPDTSMVAVGLVGDWLVAELAAEAEDGEGDDIVVYEFGFPLGINEPYRVSVSSTAEGPWVTLGDGAGVDSFDLGATGAASARFVRIESLARLADVIGGLGSPLFPGPEIDAVGAVHPGS